MTGNMAKDVCGSSVDIQNKCCGGGTKDGLKIATVDANRMCS
jgi:hypothetical protein